MQVCAYKLIYFLYKFQLVAVYQTTDTCTGILVAAYGSYLHFVVVIVSVNGQVC